MLVALVAVCISAFFVIAGRRKDSAALMATVEASDGLSNDALERIKTAAFAALDKRNLELKRSLDISTGFYNALAGLSATSIAIGVSAGVAAIRMESVKLHFEQGADHISLICLIVLLWLSLMFAILHNLLVVLRSLFEIRFASAEVVRAILNACYAEVQPPDEEGARREVAKVMDTLHEPLIQRQKLSIGASSWLQNTSTVSGFLAIAAFVSAYSLVVYRVIVFLLNG
jgi:hypothetical protein